jgi:putative peptide zinc metalloprotease protein
MAIADAAVSPPAARREGEALALADGIELIGEYQDSGFKEPPLLARRADGQVVQLPRLSYLIAEAVDGRRDTGAVAAAVSERFGRSVSPDSVQFLVDRKLRPLGVLALEDGSTPELPKRAPVMALRHRRPLVPEGAVNVIARGFAWVHTPPVLALVLLALAAFDVWLFGIHGIAGGLRSVLYHPLLLLGVLASIVVATAFHEVGHASACRYGGARPGVIGAGLYLIWPAFYCDVTDAYRLNRPGRLRTDLGGVYFNGIFALGAGIAYFATGQEALLLIAFIQHTIVLQQLLPLLRFDGYYVMSDLTGVPDILSRIKPIFRSLVPGRDAEPRVEELKPWVRVVVTTYLVVLIPLLGFLIVSTVLAAPRMAATAYDSLGLQIDRIRSAPGAPEVVLGVFQSGALVMPLAAMALSISRSGRMAGRGLIAWSSGSALRRAVAVAGTAAVAAGAAYTWWPNGDYQPIRPGERGTVGEALQSVRDAPGGRPSFTEARERRFGSVPTVREQGAAQRRRAAKQRARRNEAQRPAGSPERSHGARGTAPGDDPGPGVDDEGSDAPAPEDDPGSWSPASPTTTPDATPSGESSPTATPAPSSSSPSSPSPSPSSTATSPSPTAASTPSPTTASVPSVSPTAPTVDPVPTATPTLPSPADSATATP